METTHSLKRHILIIKGYSKNGVELENDRKIINLCINYFLSNAGGVYNKDTEITLLEDIKIEELIEIQKNKNINDCDYLITILLGHGANTDDYQAFQLNETEIIHSGQLQFSVKKQLIIIESCRNIINEIEIKPLNKLTPNYRHGGKIQKKKTSIESKQKFNQAIEQSPEGITYLFACKVNESAKNYYFIHDLIHTAIRAHEYTTCDKTYNIDVIFNHTKEKVIKKTEDIQHPVMEGHGKTPFTVSII